MAKFERQLTASPTELARLLDEAIPRSGLTLTDSASYNIDQTTAYLQVWGDLSVLILGTEDDTTVTAISPDPNAAALVEAILGK